jgi:putative flippase GtrA
MQEAPPSLVERTRSYIRTPEFARILRYGSCSAISTVVSLGGLYLFYRVVGLGPGWANIIATTIATVPSYYLNRMWAWGRTGRSHFKREVVPFWIIAFVSLGISSLAVRYAAHEAHHLTHRKEFQTLLVLMANFVTYGIMWVGKFTLFNRILFANRDDDVVDLMPIEVWAG